MHVLSTTIRLNQRSNSSFCQTFLRHGGERMKTANEMLGTRIREQRKRKKITQEQLAEKLGIDQKHMSRIELGKSYPSLDRLIKIAETLEVPLPCLFEFMHLEEERELVKQINEMVHQLSESDKRKVFKILKAFLGG